VSLENRCVLIRTKKIGGCAVLHRPRKVIQRICLLANKLRFHIFFKKRPRPGEYCNSKFIRVDTRAVQPAETRPYLAIVRCGRSHCLIDDCSERNFDIALNCYAEPEGVRSGDYEYLYVGGINKYKAAVQFISKAHLRRYRGFIFLDDDIEITNSRLSQFLAYCSTHGFGLAQPSLTHDSHFSHEHLLNASSRGWRFVPMVEVMCPYFSSSALGKAIHTFDLSYSTWGLDFVWPKLFEFRPVVVDEFSVRHVRGTAESAFYEYMRQIGVSPQRDLAQLKNISIGKVR